MRYINNKSINVYRMHKGDTHTQTLVKTITHPPHMHSIQHTGRPRLAVDRISHQRANSSSSSKHSSYRSSSGFACSSGAALLAPAPRSLSPRTSAEPILKARCSFEELLSFELAGFAARPRLRPAISSTFTFSVRRASRHSVIVTQIRAAFYHQ